MNMYLNAFCYVMKKGWYIWAALAIITALCICNAGCSFGKSVEKIEHTPAVVKSVGEGRMTYEMSQYNMYKGSDGKIYVIITVPEIPKEKK